MDETQNFDPYLDWESVDEKMSDDLHVAVVRYRHATDRFIETKSVTNAKELLRAQEVLSVTAETIRSFVYTQPVLVHIAGLKEVEIDPETGNEYTVQRCARCQSMLQIWNDGFEMPLEETSWWQEGVQVAKHVGSGVMGMYEVKEELQKHEKPCFDFNFLNG